MSLQHSLFRNDFHQQQHIKRFSQIRGSFGANETVTQLQSTSNTYLNLISNYNGTNYSNAAFVCAPQFSYWGLIGNASGTGANLPFAIYNGGTERLRIDLSGNVGIGTNAPAQKLDVNGTIKASGLIVTDGTNTQFKVYNTGYVRARDITVDALAIPDYVFEKDYSLASIEEVDVFIKQYKHLPGIPSAKEIEKDGMSVSQMQSKLLEKVEGLMLYVIQLNKEMLTLKEENEKLKATFSK